MHAFFHNIGLHIWHSWTEWSNITRNQWHESWCWASSWNPGEICSFKSVILLPWWYEICSMHTSHTLASISTLSVETRGSCSFETEVKSTVMQMHTQTLNMHRHIHAKCKDHQSIVMKPHPQTQHLEVAFSWGWGSVFLHFIPACNKRGLYAARH